MERKLPCSISNSCVRASAPDNIAQAKFLAMLPQIERQAAYRLRHLAPEEKSEAVQEVVASAFVGWSRLEQGDRRELAYASSLARYGALRYLSGRRVGSRLHSRDVATVVCQRRHGFSVERLGHFDKGNGRWQELVAEDRRATPAEVAAVRLDFAAWLATLPKRTRSVAENLACGETTAAVARVFGVTPGRISQLRRELYRAWSVFQQDAVR
jgi:hypothetical protein